MALLSMDSCLITKWNLPENYWNQALTTSMKWGLKLAIAPPVILFQHLKNNMGLLPKNTFNLLINQYERSFISKPRVSG